MSRPSRSWPALSCPNVLSMVSEKIIKDEIQGVLPNPFEPDTAENGDFSNQLEKGLS